uniref:semaphorin-5B n=1 Tax=Gasterosteus aculeatus aculeatus TaxID=481459 RepID=UPI001A99A0F3|nr:semaphorin-5B [Gasterosteus aculeatus aculeatus]
MESISTLQEPGREHLQTSFLEQDSHGNQLHPRGEVITMTASLLDSSPLSMAGLFLFLLLPTSAAQDAARPPPQVLFDQLTQPECSKKEHPKVSVQALSPWISSFSPLGVRDFSQLTLDLTRNELIVGARNFLFRLDLVNMSLIQVGALTSSSTSPSQLRMKVSSWF